MIAALANIGRTGLVVGGCNAVGFGITALLETHKITDLVGAGSFVVATTALSIKNNLHQYPLQNIKLSLINVGVMIWGIRLASFLFQRVLQVGEDKRLNKFFREPGESYLDAKRSLFPIKLAGFWTIQSMWGFLCLLPVSVLNSVPLTTSSGIPNPLLSFIGKSPFHTGRYTDIYYILLILYLYFSSYYISLFINYVYTLYIHPGTIALSVLPVLGIYTGIFIEALADTQKNQYRNDQQNDGHWCDKGLWKYSRHPNCTYCIDIHYFTVCQVILPTTTL